MTQHLRLDGEFYPVEHSVLESTAAETRMVVPVDTAADATMTSHSWQESVEAKHIPLNLPYTENKVGLRWAHKQGYNTFDDS